MCTISIVLSMITFVRVMASVDSQSVNSSSKTTISCFPDSRITYTINLKKTCKDLAPTLVIGVHSSPSHYLQRDLIRNTYGSFQRVSKQTVLIVFIIGQVTDAALQEQIEAESTKYDDVIQANFLDSYRNLTLKHASLLNWVNEHCKDLSFFMKIDDDVFVDVFHLTYMLEKEDIHEDFICKIVVVFVNRVGRWAVTMDEYNKTSYPPYCEGFAYILANVSMLPQIVKSTLKSEFFWIDDVLVTGFVKERLGLRLRYFPNNFGFTEIDVVSNLDVTNFMIFRNDRSMIDVSLWYKVWRMMLQHSFDAFL